VGGAGKTRLAERYADTLRGDPVVWRVPLADVEEPHLVGLAVLETLGLHSRPPDSPVDTVAELIGESETLLLLDNCEQVRQAAADLAVELLARCPNLRILTTSRHSLGVSGEVVYPVPPLTVPSGDAQVRLPELESYDGVRLFLQRASAAMPGFVPTETNAPAIARLCGALEGLPLALELAAARITALTPEVMTERLEDRYGLLSRGYVDTPGRQRSLLASVMWSYDLCTPQEQLLWARLSVFSGGFGLEAAEQVCSGNGLDRAEILDVLQNLIDKSLVTRDSDEGLHYRMLETIRQFGVARLAEAGESERLRGRHRDWFVTLSWRLGAEWTGPGQAAWLDHWRRNHANLRVVLEDTAQHPQDAPVALRLVMALEGYWLVTGLLTEERHWLELALSHGTGPVAERSMAIGMLGYLAAIRGDTDEALTRLAEAHDLLQHHQDDLARAYLAFAAASIHFFAGDHRAALDHSLESIERFRRLGVVNHVSVALMICGVCREALGDVEGARAARAECLQITEASGELYTRSLVLWSLGVVARDEGDLATAYDLQLQALSMKWALGDQPGLAIVLEALATIASAQGDGDRAATLLGAARSIWTRVQGDPAAAPFIAKERELAESLARSVLAGRTFERGFRRGAAMTQRDVVAYAAGKETGAVPAPAGGDPGQQLTTREAEVTELLGQGLSNQEIADRLVISVRTAQGHVENILRKLGFSSRTQVAAWVASHRGSLG
jgi:predicted ATPase/DNA-binding CsgD family transcriptional regulator